MLKWIKNNYESYKDGWIDKETGNKHRLDDDLFCEFIQSLSQPKYPIAFECEIEINHNEVGNDGFMFDEMSTIPVPKIRTITNSQMLVGKYIYND